MTREIELQEEWFATWFDSPYYHVLYKHRDESEAEMLLGNLAAILNLPQGAKVLDLACGRGRHTMFLHSMGYQACGVDLSANSIAFAKKQVRGEGPTFYEHDMREPVLGQSFSLVLNLFTSFGYFKSRSENLKVLQSAGAALTSGGMMVLDYANAEKLKEQLVEEEVKEVDGIEFHIKRQVENNYVVKSIDFNAESKAYHFEERVYAFNLQEFREMFVEAEMEIVSLAGNYNLDKFDARHSDRLILIARKVN